MTVGPLSRADLSRTSITERSNSGSKMPTLFTGPSFGVSQIFQAFAQTGPLPLTSSPDSSRDASPVRLASGSLTATDLKPSARASCTSDVGPAEAAGSTLGIDAEAILQEVPSYGYELGHRALWLDRHPSLRSSSRYSCPDDGQAEGYALSKQSPLAERKQQTASCLSYCPSWHISESMVWALAERYVQGAPPPSPFSPSAADPSTVSSQPPTPTKHSVTAGLTNATAASGSPSSPEATPAAAPPAVLSPLDSRRSCREVPPLPSGIGPIGLASPSQRFRRAALCIIAKGRMEIKKSLREADLLDEMAAAGAATSSSPSADTEGGAAAAGGGGGAAAPSPLSSRSPTAPTKRLGSLRIDQLVADAVADAVATSPTSRAVVRRRVRVLVAGLSVAYAAANLGGCAAALVHADFANDFASSAKAVLDFMITAPSVTGIAADLVQIGVAVGLGMAQRRPPC